MGARTTISGSAWNQATGTAATAGTTGLAATTGFTHVAAADLPVALPPGVSGVALGAIKTTSGVAGTFKIDATGHNSAASTRYSVKFWLLAYRTDPTLAAITSGSASASAILAYNAAGANKNTFYLGVIKDATFPRDHSGLFLVMRNTNTGVWFGAHGCADGASFQYPNFEFERWGRVSLILSTSAAATADGSCAATVNGQFCARQTGLITDTLAAGNDTVTLPAHTGIEYYVVAIASYDGTGDAEYTQAPDASGGQFITPSAYDVVSHWPYYASTGTAAPGGLDEGSNWYTSAGSAPVETAYSAYSGVDGGRVRAVWTDLAGTTQESTRKIGTLQYNAEGWASLYFGDFLDFYGTVTTLTHTLTVYQSDNVTVALKLLWDDKFIYQTSVSTANRICPRPPGRMALTAKFNSDYRLQIQVDRLSDAAPGTAVYDVYPMSVTVPLAIWTVTALGKITYAYSGGGTAGGSQIVEFGGVAQCRYNTRPGIDSFNQALSGGTGMATSGKELSLCTGLLMFGTAFAGLRQCEGPMCPGFFKPASGPVYCFQHPVGWSGKTVARFANSHGRAHAATSGDRIVWCGNIANSIGGATTPALAVSVADAWAKDVASVVIPGVEHESCHDIILPWVGSTGGGFTTAGAANVAVCIDRCRSELKRRLRAVDTHGRVRMLDSVGGYAEQGGNEPHLTAAGYCALASEAKSGMQTVVMNASRRRRNISR